MKRYIKSDLVRPYYRLDHIGSHDKDEHCGFTSLSALQDKLKKFGLPLELANFDNREDLPDYIKSTGTYDYAENTYAGWKTSVRR